MRKVPLWIGKTDDSPVPPRVRLRVFRNAGGLCHISGRIIQAGEAWHLEHVEAIMDGGRNSEDNLRPALVGAHKVKTATEMHAKAKGDRIAKKTLGISPAKRPIASRQKPEKPEPRFNRTPLTARQLYGKPK